MNVPRSQPDNAELYCSWCNQSGHAPQPECRAGFPGQFPTAEDQITWLRIAMARAVDLLAERTYGSPARSSGHNARMILEAALRGPSVPLEQEKSHD